MPYNVSKLISNKEVEQETVKCYYFSSGFNEANPCEQRAKESNWNDEHPLYRGCEKKVEAYEKKNEKEFDAKLKKMNAKSLRDAKRAVKEANMKQYVCSFLLPCLQQLLTPITGFYNDVKADSGTSRPPSCHHFRTHHLQSFCVH